MISPIPQDRLDEITDYVERMCQHSALGKLTENGPTYLATGSNQDRELMILRFPEIEWSFIKRHIPKN